MTRLARKTRIARSCEYRCALLLPDKNPPGIFNTAIVGAAVVVVVVCPCSSTCSHVKTWRPLDTNHDTWPSKRRYDLRVDHSDAKKEIESKRAIKSRRVSLSSRLHFFFPLPRSPSHPPFRSFYYYLSVHLSIYLSISVSLAPYVCPFAGLSDLCIVPQSRYLTLARIHTLAYIGTRAHTRTRTSRCDAVHTTRRDPSLVRSHFKHLLYHDRSARSVLSRYQSERAFLARGPLELGEKTTSGRNETSMVPRHKLKIHSRSRACSLLTYAVCVTDED